VDNVVKEYTRQLSDSGLISAPLSLTETLERPDNGFQAPKIVTESSAVAERQSFQFDVLGGPDKGSFDVLGRSDKGFFDVFGGTDLGGFEVLGGPDRGAFDVLGGPDKGSFDVFGNNR